MNIANVWTRSLLSIIPYADLLSLQPSILLRLLWSSHKKNQKTFSKSSWNYQINVYFVQVQNFSGKTLVSLRWVWCKITPKYCHISMISCISFFFAYSKWGEHCKVTVGNEAYRFACTPSLFPFNWPADSVCVVFLAKNTKKKKSWNNQKIVSFRQNLKHSCPKGLQNC